MKRLKCFVGMHNFKLVKDCGVTKYYECSCGKRTCFYRSCSYQAIDRNWIRTGVWTEMTNPPRQSDHCCAHSH